MDDQKISRITKLIKSVNLEEVEMIGEMIKDRIMDLKHERHVNRGREMKKVIQAGDTVSWHAKQGKWGGVKVSGIVIRLNSKSATIKTKEQGQWLVDYSLLTKEFSHQPAVSEMVYEAEVVEETDQEAKELELLTSTLLKPEEFRKKRTQKKKKKSHKRSRKRKKGRRKK